MVCPYCHQENPAGLTQCRNCGKRLEDGVPAPSHDITEISDHHRVRETLVNGRFRVLKVLGRGGMGEIFLAEDTRLKRKVAVKSISRQHLHDADSRARFLREAQTASQLDHPNICTIYEICEEEDREYIIMQYIEGATIDQLLHVKPLSIAKVLEIALQICEGMIEAHEKGVVHRDIKTNNIMVDRNGKIKILDFGLAKFMEPADSRETAVITGDPGLTAKGIVIGTASSMSPEQARGGAVDHRSDIFSFGVVLYEMVEGRNPFHEKDSITTIYNLLNKEVTFSRPMPPALQALIARTLEKERNRRPEDFRAIRDELRRIQAGWEEDKNRREAQQTEVIHSGDLPTAAAPLTPGVSDNEHLSDLVRRFRGMKASTEAQPFTRRNALRRLLPWAAAALPVLGLLVVFLLHRAPGGQQPPPPAAVRPYVLLHPLQGDRIEPLTAAAINYLLRQALDGCAEFAVIDEETARRLSGAGPGPLDLRALRKKLPVKFTLGGRIEQAGGLFNLEGRFHELDKSEEAPPFQFPGRETDCLLTDQIDNLARRVQSNVRRTLPTAPAAAAYQPLTAAFGNDWAAFKECYQGIRAWERKEYTPASRALQSALQRNPGLPAAHFHLALYYDYFGPRSQAWDHLRVLLPQADTFPLPLKQRVMALKAKLEFDIPAQIAALAPLRERFPQQREIYYELGEAYFHSGQAGKALEEYQKALQIDPAYSDVLNHAGYCHSYLGDHDRAIEAFERYRTLDQTANSFDSLGDGYFFKGDYVQAENNKSFAIGLDRNMSFSWLTIADVAVLLARYREAEQALARYEQENSGSRERADALLRRAFILYDDQRPQEALEKVNAAMALCDSRDIVDNTSEYHWLKGLILLQLRRTDEARRESAWLGEVVDKYHLSAANFEKCYKYFLHLGARLAEAEGRFPEAERFFTDLTAMKASLCYWVTYFHRQYFETEYAAYLARRNEKTRALAVLAECLKYNADYPPALWLKASLREADAPAEARAVYQTIQRVYGQSAVDNARRRELARKLAR